PVSSPASDWYSVGVMLYMALTGRQPFTGNIVKMLKDKLAFEPPPPSELCPGVPEDLDNLCRAMLRRLPEYRPSGAEILKRLARRLGVSTIGAVAGTAAPLFGRDRHLRLLEEAYASSQQRRAVLVSIHGPSGIGKSYLVRHFLDSLQDRGAVVLAGRCYE